MIGIFSVRRCLPLAALVICMFAGDAVAQQIPARTTAPAAQKEQFMAACLKGKTTLRACECTYESVSPVLNAREMELMIAYLSDDKKRQEEIKSDPKFDYRAYDAKSGASFARSLACVQRK